MNEGRQGIQTKTVSLKEVAEALRQTLPFAGTNFDDLGNMGPVEQVTAAAGSVLVEPWETDRAYWVVLQGEARADRPEPDGSRTTVGFARSGEGFGETPLLIGRTHTPFVILAVEDSLLIKFDEEGFWALMSCCPAARKVVLANMAQRLQTYQVEALHREKLVSLGTMAAGLMHELHNPGSAAKRASSQLRLNLLRLQQLSLRFSDAPKTHLQLECMRTLLEHTVSGCHAPAMSTLEQSDAEEAMAEWLGAAGVENAFSIAPALVGIGFKHEELACAKDAFTATSFSDALNWLEALVSSVTLVCTIEESITRISDLVMAVKKFAYDEKSPAKELDVHDSLQSTLTILGHKLRIKGIQVDKDFAARPSTIRTRGSSLSQVWTNLIDNALDASPSNGKIKIATWIEAGSEAAPEKLGVSIEDHGAGIAPEALPRIFEAFFTTKPQGSGTGLGLEIVHRIVTQKFGGTIDVESEPGSTRFIVRLPLDGAAGSNCTVPAH
ncbi:MAG TPA: ATP-binding protein [Terracidiphilus sp.]|jgi:signal transduction histidine kinase